MSEEYSGSIFIWQKTKLQFNYSEIYQISLAQNNNLVFIGKKNNRDLYLVHLGQNKKTVLWEFKLPDYTYFFSMINAWEVIIQNYPCSSVDIISLRQKRSKSVEYRPMKMVMHTSILTFTETHIFCIVEYSNRVTGLTYFSYGGLNSQTVCLKHFQIRNYSDYTVRKLDNHSKIGWMYAYELHLYDLEIKNQYSISLQDQFMEAMQERFNSKISKVDIVWQLSKDVYLLYVYVKPRSFGSQLYQIQLFVLTIQNRQRGHILLQYLQLPRKFVSSLTSFNNTLIYVIKGIIAIVRKDVVFNKQHQIMYLHQKTGQPLVIQPFKNHKLLFNSQSYYDESFLQARISNHKQTVEVQTTLVQLNFPMKDIYMHYLLHMNDDFDDDLLLDAMRLLVNQDQQQQ